MAGPIPIAESWYKAANEISLWRTMWTIDGLSPVLSRSEGNEISSFQIDYMNIDNNDVSREITGGGHSLSRVPTFTENGTNSFLELEERTYHVYTEIAEISTENSNVADSYDCKSHVSSSIEKSTAIDSEVVYMNVKSEQI